MGSSYSACIVQDINILKGRYKNAEIFHYTEIDAICGKVKMYLSRI